jgi:hypothetical protein
VFQYFYIRFYQVAPFQLKHLHNRLIHPDTGVPRGGFGGFKPPPPRNSEILTKYQKLRKFYYMK